MPVALAWWVLAASVLAGCNAGNANPHLLAPKLLVQPHRDGNVTLFVHGAFGERLYESLDLSVENVSVLERTDAFSLETKVGAPGFFVEVVTEVDGERYWLRARLDVDHGADRVRVVPLGNSGGWGESESYALPYERIIERVSS